MCVYTQLWIHNQGNLLTTTRKLNEKVTYHLVLAIQSRREDFVSLSANVVVPTTANSFFHLSGHIEQDTPFGVAILVWGHKNATVPGHGT